MFNTSIKDIIYPIINWGKNAKEKSIDTMRTYTGSKGVELITEQNEKVTHILIGMDNEITSIHSKLTTLELKIKSLDKENPNRKLLYLIIALAFSVIINIVCAYFVLSQVKI